VAGREDVIRDDRRLADDESERLAALAEGGHYSRFRFLSTGNYSLPILLSDIPIPPPSPSRFD